MKLKNLFFGSLACLAFAACSNDDDVVVNPSAKGDGGQYIAVNIVNPVETRATAATPEYEDATGKETQVNDVLLVFCKGNNIFNVQDVTTLSDTEDTGNEGGESGADKWEGGTTAPQVEKVSAAIAYLVPDETGGIPDGMIVLLNAKAFNWTADKVKALGTVTALRETIEDYGVGASTDKFLMTSSVWAEQSNGVTPITNANFAPSKTEAIAADKIVDVYVERVIAKVNVELSSSFENTGKTEYIVDENGNATSTVIKPLFYGYHLAATTKQSYMIKSINTSWVFKNASDVEWTWNDATNKRSFWALMPTTVEYQYLPWSQNGGNATKATFYPQENTSTTKTELVVLAQLKKVADAAAIPTAADADAELVFLNGVYYTLAGFTTKIASVLDEKFTGEPSGWNWKEKIEIKKLKQLAGYGGREQWEMVAQLKTGTDLTGMTAAGTWNADFAEVNTKLIEEHSAFYWQDGKAYYHVKIEHDGFAEATHGIVRNHVYNLTLNSVVGLGTPVYDPGNDDDPTTPSDPSTPEEPIIPDDPTEAESYIGAKINVLKWRILEQGVDLGK